MSELHYQRDSKKAVYVSSEMFRALWLLSKTKGFEVGMLKGRGISPDEIADRLLKEAIKSKWPQLFEFQKEQEKAEKTLIEILRTNESKYRTIQSCNENQ